MEVMKIWYFLKGYVIIRVEGLTLERFLNLAATNDIYLWDISREGYTVLEMKATIEGFRSLKGIVKRVGCRVEIIDKRGLPFLFYRLKSRKMLAFGFVLFLGIIFFLSSLIWNIEIVGNENVKTEDIIKILEKEEIKSGIIKYKIDKDYIKYLLLNEFDNFSFLSVEIKGTKMIIQVKEQDLPPERINKDMPCNIVASKKGVILKAIARNGRAVVRKGDVVKEGEILITGAILDEHSQEQILVHADGEVLAQTIYSHRIDEPIIKTIKEETGRTYTRREYRIGEKGIQFSKGEIPFKDYIEEIKELRPFNLDMKLPVKILVHQYKEVEIKEVKQNIDFLKQSTHIRAVEELNKQLPKDVQIQSKDVKYYLKDDILSTYVTLEVIEDIGKKQIIYGN